MKLRQTQAGFGPGGNDSSREGATKRERRGMNAERTEKRAQGCGGQRPDAKDRRGFCRADGYAPEV